LDILDRYDAKTEILFTVLDGEGGIACALPRRDL
jgi:hypothetical protein